MDLSQQELPLTAYFTRGGKEARSLPIPSKRDKPSEDSRSVTRSSKRSRGDARCSPATSSSSADQYKPWPATLQLPTPGTSARKRMRDGRLEELPCKTRLTSSGVLLSSVKQNPILSSEKDHAQQEFGPTPPKSTRASRKSTEGAVPESPLTPLTMSSTTDPTESPLGPRLFGHTETGIATLRTPSRRVSKPADSINNHTPLARSNYRLLCKSSQVSPGLIDPGVSPAVLPRTPLLAPSTTGPPCPSVDSSSSDPFHTENDSVSVPRVGISALSKQYLVRSETLNDQSSDGHVIPTMPVSSSQSQYLLHPDATPKRKRCSRHIEHVFSSQTQEERELTLSMSHEVATMVGLSAGVFPKKHALYGNAQIPHFSCSERKSRPSRDLATKKVSDERLRKSLSPLRRKRLASCNPPSGKIQRSRRYARQDSIENVPPVYMEDFLTESETDSEFTQILRRSLVPCDASVLVQHGFAQESLPEDDSATEAESDTEILRCVAEIGKRQPRERRSETPREGTPPVVSPLVTPTRSRIAGMISTEDFTRPSMREVPELGVPESLASYPPTTEQPQTQSESLPSVVRDFIHMFPGEGSYPDDFPESLRT